MSLVDQSCVPCREGTPPLDRSRIASLIGQLDEGWDLNLNSHIEKSYKFKNFSGPMSFANRIAELADSEGHHPDLHITWGKCVIEIWTHAIQGLSENDFVLAAKVDRLWSVWK